MSTCSKKFFW